jgi:hypothetical protein
MLDYITLLYLFFQILNINFGMLLELEDNSLVIHKIVQYKVDIEYQSKCLVFLSNTRCYICKRKLFHSYYPYSYYPNSRRVFGPCDEILFDGNYRVD